MRNCFSQLIRVFVIFPFLFSPSIAFASTNTTINNTTTTSVSQSNTSNITNTVNSNCNTGNNSSSNNTGGSTVSTGSCDTTVSITNDGNKNSTQIVDAPEFSSVIAVITFMISVTLLFTFKKSILLSKSSIRS